MRFGNAKKLAQGWKRSMHQMKPSTSLEKESFVSPLIPKHPDPATSVYPGI